ncbi:MAG TPA: hypothetical protein VFX15_06795 [Actinomycetes bacterium]|nr:hypothetical protein [Actinomycetes bacterium]
MQDAVLSIQKDTAWVTLTDKRYRGSSFRLERHHAWKVVDPE